MRFQSHDKKDPFCTKGGSMSLRPKPKDICLDARAVRHRVSFTIQHIGRLERAGRFPKRIHLGPARVGWSLRDVLAWMQSKVDARPSGPTSEKVSLDTDARFIQAKELRSVVLYSVSHLRLLELAGQFPKRIWISDNRIVWLESEVQEWLDSKRAR